MAVKIRSAYDYDFSTIKVLESGGLSETVPDQALTVREIMERFASGLDASHVNVSVWNGEDNDLPDFSMMSTMDRAEYLHDNAQRIRELQQKASFEESQRLEAAMKRQLEQQQKQYPLKTPPEAKSKDKVGRKAPQDHRPEDDE